jgi:hypothetical protein
VIQGLIEILVTLAIQLPSLLSQSSSLHFEVRCRLICLSNLLPEMEDSRNLLFCLSSHLALHNLNLGFFGGWLTIMKRNWPVVGVMRNHTIVAQLIITISGLERK